MNPVSECQDPVAADMQTAQEHMARLVGLYGDEVIPHGVTKVYNLGFGRLEHACATGTDIRHVRAQFYEAISRSVLFIEERPVVTRFFTFTRCC